MLNNKSVIIFHHTIISYHYVAQAFQRFIEYTIFLTYIAHSNGDFEVLNVV